MSILVIGGPQKKDLEEVKNYALAHPIRWKDYVNIDNANDEEKMKYCCVIPVGFQISFTIEIHSVDDEEIGRYARHLGVRIGKPGKVPNQYVVQEIMDCLGFENRIGSEALSVWLQGNTANVLEYFNINENPLYTRPNLEGT
jgi:hypothetical protein